MRLRAAGAAAAATTTTIGVLMVDGDQPVQRLLCLQCGNVAETGEELADCPSCGDSKHVAANLNDTVNLTITRHELRILTMWASNWAAQTGDPPTMQCIKTVLERLGMQTDTALTLSQEIADLRAAFPDSRVSVYDQSGKPIDL